MPHFLDRPESTSLTFSLPLVCACVLYVCVLFEDFYRHCYVVNVCLLLLSSCTWLLFRLSLLKFIIFIIVISEISRRETAYACEGKTLTIECRNGEVIDIIRANYGRYSITICNDRGNTEWSVNCMSNKSIGVMRTRLVYCFLLLFMYL